MKLFRSNMRGANGADSGAMDKVRTQERERESDCFRD